MSKRKKPEAIDPGKIEYYFDGLPEKQILTTAMPKSILSEAESLIYQQGDRSSQYGPAKEDYGRAVALYMILCGTPSRMETAEDGLLFMMCVKLSRLAYAFQGKAKWKRDTAVDLCGYTSLLNDLEEKK